jgi:hypothetical protein
MSSTGGDNLAMDAAGARALARRIADQQARGDEDAQTTPAVPAQEPAQPSFAEAPRTTPPPAVSRGGDSASVRPAGQMSQGGRDVRRYTTEVRREDSGEGPTVITTIRCHSLVDGHWQSRVVEVRAESV